MPAAPFISWREPSWSFRPRYISELEESGLFTFRFWLRVYAISALIALVAILGLYLFQPHFRLPPQVFVAPLVVPVFVALKFGPLYFFPPDHQDLAAPHPDFPWGCGGRDRPHQAPGRDNQRG